MRFKKMRHTRIKKEEKRKTKFQSELNFSKFWGKSTATAWLRVVKLFLFIATCKHRIYNHNNKEISYFLISMAVNVVKYVSIKLIIIKNK